MNANVNNENPDCPQQSQSFIQIHRLCNCPVLITAVSSQCKSALPQLLYGFCGVTQEMHSLCLNRWTVFLKDSLKLQLAPAVCALQIFFLFFPVQPLSVRLTHSLALISLLIVGMFFCFYSVCKAAHSAQGLLETDNPSY